MEKHDELFTPEQVDQQIERYTHRAIEERDATTGNEINTHLLLDLKHTYRQQASARQEALERVLGRLLQYEARSSSTSPRIPQERKPHMDRPISGSTTRHTLPQRLGLLAAAALLILLVGSMAVIINLAHQQKETTGKQRTTKTVSTTTATAQSNLYATSNRVVKKLDSKSGKVLWTFTAPGGVYTPVTVADGIAYVVPQDNAIFALNATNGKLLWQTAYKHFSGSVAVAQNTVYARDPNNDFLYALNASNGQVRWQRQLGIPVADLLVNNGIIYAAAFIESPSTAAHAVLYAFKASDGTVIWHIAFSDQSLVKIAQIVDGKLYVSSTVDDKGANPPDRHSYVYAFDAATGARLWRSVEIKAYVGIAPVVANNLVYIGSDTLGTEGPAIYAFSASDGSLAWKKAVSTSVDTCMLVNNGTVYVAEATSSFNVTEPVLALDASNGTVRWSHQLSYYYGFGQQDCTSNANLFYIITDDSIIHVLQASDGAQVGSYSLGKAYFPMLPQTLVMAP